ncbi:hypothetical protein ACJROX_26760 [Pseudalkalibacillus sp. A8]|uniref:hypothetical protein n=1 Tax=Pseudalkalibacillus sp. A8 TaxID=3382641 RepID=UPI0038B5495D
MSKKVKKISWWAGGFIVFIVIFISIMTWFYPYSPFSVNKSYAYKPDKILFNGKSYEQILNEFKASYEKDLKADADNKYPNLTINRTQYILPIFEQDWLINESSVPIDAMKLDMMLFEVQQVREVLLNLDVQVDYTSEQRRYLVDMIRSIISLEDNIIELQNENYASRKELNRRFDNLYGAFTSNFRRFSSFYKWG